MPLEVQPLLVSQRAAWSTLPVTWSMAVSPPTGGSIKPASAPGGGPGEITRKVWLLSTDPNQVLPWVPVPVGPLTKTRPCGSMPMSGSPLVWIGSTTVGVEKAMPGAATAGRPDIDAPAATTNAEPTAGANFGRTIPCLLASPNKGPADFVIPRVAHKMYRSPHPSARPSQALHKCWE